MDTIFSLIGGAYKLLIDVPVFGIGVLVGGFGWNFLLKRNPTLLNKLVATVQAEATKLESAAASKTTTGK